MTASARAVVPHPLAPDLRPVNDRDLAWLIVVLLLVIVPHAMRAPWWLGVLTVCLYAWRIAIARLQLPLPSRWVLLAIAVLAMAGVWAEYRILFGRSPGIVLLMLFSGLKLLELRNHRDASMVVFLCYFLIVTQFLYSQTIPTAIAMFCAMVLITAALISFNAPHRRPREDLRAAGLLLAHAVPAALVLFVLFPRVQGPLWGLPQDAHAGVSGLSDTMSPGNLSRLALSDALAFRAEFESEPPPQPLRYWRGPVLWDFDGRTWRMGHSGLGRPPFPETGPERYRYTVVQEPNDQPWLFGLETILSVPPRARYSDDGRLLARERVQRRLRYDVVSVADGAAVPERDVETLDRALRLPEGFNPRARALASEWRRSTASDEMLVRQALEYFQNGKFTYTLEPPLLNRHTVDEFVFDTRAGFCEYFSNAFVFLMRAAGVPARVVTGYQGGELNPVDRIITVRQSDAHAWAEVHLAGQGWVRVDPTAAAMPGRIASGLARALPESPALPLLMRPRFEWLRAVRYNWDALTHRWNIWVLGYSADRQRDLLASLGMRDANWRSLTTALVTILGAFTLGLLAWSLRRMVRPDPVQRAWLAFCGMLARRGVSRAPHEGPRDFAERAADTLPAAGETIRAIGADYVGLRYGSTRADERIREFQRRIRQFGAA